MREVPYHEATILIFCQAEMSTHLEKIKQVLVGLQLSPPFFAQTFDTLLFPSHHLFCSIFAFFVQLLAVRHYIL